MKCPKHKGTGLIPVVAAIKAIPGLSERLPDHLARYLCDPILPSGWYPEEDYHCLLVTLARAVDRAALQSNDVWTSFGILGARRDVAGDQEDVPEANRVHSVGIYRRFAPGQGSQLSELLLRLQKLWGVYHDSGSMRMAHDPAWGPRVRVELADFGFPERGVLKLQLAYACEYVAQGGFRLEGTILSYGGDKQDAVHRWEYVAEDTSWAMSSLERLPRPD